MELEEGAGQLKRNNKHLYAIVCVTFIILFFNELYIFGYPADEIFCSEDYWVQKVELSKRKIVARSYLPSEGKYNYYPENVIDNNNNTCWCAKGNGIDQFIILKIPKGIKGFKIKNGVTASDSLYSENNRVKKLYWGLIAEKYYESKEEEIHDNCKMSKPGMPHKYCMAFQTSLRYDNIVLKDINKPQNIIFSNIEGFSWSLYKLSKTKVVYLVVGIIDIYKGRKYNDTCISEIEIIK